MQKGEFFSGFKDCIPTLFGYLSTGFACEVVSRSCGMTIIETVAMSTFIYAGSSQFIAASMVISSAIALIISIQIVSVNTGIIISAVVGAIIGGIVKR